MAKDFEGSLRKIAALGYRQVEFAGYYNRTPEQIRALLDELKLESPSTHVPIQALRSNPAEGDRGGEDHRSPLPDLPIS
jgi:sugar phosphate isomerase/epimerase